MYVFFFYLSLYIYLFSDISAQSGELLPIQPLPTGEKHDGLVFLDQLLFAVILTLASFTTIKAFDKTTFILLKDLLKKVR